MCVCVRAIYVRYYACIRLGMLQCYICFITCHSIQCHTQLSNIRAIYRIRNRLFAYMSNTANYKYIDRIGDVMHVDRQTAMRLNFFLLRSFINFYFNSMCVS